MSFPNNLFCSQIAPYLVSQFVRYQTFIIIADTTHVVREPVHGFSGILLGYLLSQSDDFQLIDVFGVHAKLASPLHGVEGAGINAKTPAAKQAEISSL